MPRPSKVARNRGCRVNEEHEAREQVEPRADGAMVPRVQTLLLCDLADSTALVERLGDSTAAELIRKHDRLARDLLHRHHGREIDKTDGFLALFERPVQATAFALEYQKVLRRLGGELALHPDAGQDTDPDPIGGAALSARVGIHVGEVVLWENSASEVAGGAKRVDVEGLAKPVAARLMALALPGQILLSGIAFSLAQRAAPELDEAAGLRWLTHGRYRFKGVAAPMLVHEVGQPGLAPLRAPPSTAKAQRDLPLWRRPAVIAFEAVVLLAAIAVPLALSLRVAPAIAFGERDWVVVAELRNLTGESQLDESLETAFRISLEQSRHVNVLSDLKLRGTLARMQKPADTHIDRGIASEIALRDGARAVILPTVAEVGGRLRISAEVIDPHTQTTVYAESADGVGAQSALESIDSVTHTLREKLGETLASIEKDSAPLPQVTTANMDALRAYALGDRAYQAGDLKQARALFEQALQLDSGFALALTGMARVNFRDMDYDAARAAVDRALALIDRLTPRDALYTKAWGASLQTPAAAITGWRTLTELYPDHLDGVYNLAMYQATAEHRFADCLKTTQRIDLPIYAAQDDAIYLKAHCELGLNRIDAALADFERARTLGVEGVGFIHAGAHAAARDFPKAWARLEQARQSQARGAAIEYVESATSFHLDVGDFAQAAALVAPSAAASEEVPKHFTAGVALQALVVSTLDGASDAEQEQLRALLSEQLRALPGQPFRQARPQAALVLLTALISARSGDVESGTRALAGLPGVDELTDYPLHEALRDCLRAELERAAGRHGAALAMLPRTSQPRALLLQDATRLRVLMEAGRHQEAAPLARELAGQRGRAYAEANLYGLLTPLNVGSIDIAWLQAAEAHAALGDAQATGEALRHLTVLWPAERWPESIRQRVARLQPASPAPP